MAELEVQVLAPLKAHPLICDALGRVSARPRFIANSADLAGALLLLARTQELPASQQQILQELPPGVRVMSVVDWLEPQLGLTFYELFTEDEWRASLEGIPYATESTRRRKRVFDFALGIPLFLLLLPIVLVAMLLVRGDSPGNPIYRGKRYGRHYRPIHITKLRTMAADSAKQSPVTAPLDTRITRVGQWLRKIKIDEAPQLLDVFAGQVHLIGPRPITLDEDDTAHAHILLYGKDRYLQAPGITGWAQLYTGNPVCMIDCVDRHRADMYYVKNFSLMLDLRLLFQTLWMVLLGCDTNTKRSPDGVRAHLQIPDEAPLGLGALECVLLCCYRKTVVVDVARQKLYCIAEGAVTHSWPISTSQFGIGSELDSYKTPQGFHHIAEFIGDDAPLNMRFIGRRPVGTIGASDLCPDEDYITTRIMRLRGNDIHLNRIGRLETWDRYIYIHGTPFVDHLGHPASKGCIRMAPEACAQLYALLKQTGDEPPPPVFIRHASS